jgi:hypothetical protein
MKIIMIECTAEELEANKTIADSITEALSKFTRRLVGIDLDSSQAAEVLRKMNKEEETEEESENEE